MATREEFEAAVDAFEEAIRDEYGNVFADYRGVGYQVAHAALLAMWPEPLTCDGCLFDGAPMPLDGERCYICRRYPHVDNYQPKERADARADRDRLAERVGEVVSVCNRADKMMAGEMIVYVSDIRAALAAEPDGGERKDR